LRRVVVVQFIPRNQLRQLDRAIITREFAAERQEKILERELMTILTSVNLENSGQLLGSNWPIGAHFSVKKKLESITPQWIWPYSGISMWRYSGPL
jgi:hypothetical protein